MIMMNEDIKVFLLATLCIRTHMYNVLQTRSYYKLHYGLIESLFGKELSNHVKSGKKWAYLDDDENVVCKLFT